MIDFPIFNDDPRHNLTLLVDFVLAMDEDYAMKRAPLFVDDLISARQLSLNNVLGDVIYGSNLEDLGLRTGCRSHRFSTDRLGVVMRCRGLAELDRFFGQDAFALLFSMGDSKLDPPMHSEDFEGRRLQLVFRVRSRISQFQPVTE